MNRTLIHKTISLVTSLALLFSFVPPPAALAQSQAQPDPCAGLSVSYSIRGTEVVNIKCANKTVDASGNISVDMAVEAKTSLTYGLLFSVESGTVSGGTIEVLLRAKNRAIPLVGQRTLDIGRVTFSPGAHLKLVLDKFELVPGDAPMLVGLDLITAFLLFTGFGYIPTKSAELLPAVGEGFVQLLILQRNLALLRKIVYDYETLPVSCFTKFAPRSRSKTT